MSQRYLIVVGDPTTVGGGATEGQSLCMIECTDGVRRGLVCVDDPVLCGLCGMTQVAEGVQTVFVNKSAAYDGCTLACGHKMVSKLQRLLSAEVSEAKIFLPTLFASTAESKPSHSSPYDLRFSLRDPISRMPARGVRYRITLESGRVFEGVTDEDGMTAAAHSSSAELATMELFHDEGSGESRGCADTCGC